MTPNRRLWRLVPSLLCLLLLALAGESVGWHDHPLEAAVEYGAQGVAVVHHAGGFEDQDHFDDGTNGSRPACWACILASSARGEGGTPVVLPVPSRRGETALAPGSEAAGSADLARPGARGPPLLLPTPA